MMYGFSKSTDLLFDDAVIKVTEELKKEGFGVLTSIDVQETMKKKLNVDFPKYIILGACNPPFAYQALQAEEEIGLLLHCNVIVFEKKGKITIAVFDPMAMMNIVKNSAVLRVAKEMKERLERVIAAV